jgi:hypothetical protein
MNEGVKILLERMKTNPEEFTAGEDRPYIFGNGSKWGSLIMQYRDYLNEEDKKMLEDALNKINQQAFTEAVMKELLAPEEDDSLGKPWYSKQDSITLSAGATQGQYSAQHQLQVEHIKAHLKALQNQKQKKHKTLFGKLFNYT